MANGKKSFILYCDQRGIFDKLSDEQAGALIKHIFSYVNDENPEGDFITELAFEGIKTALKRDLKKYEGYIDKQRENGRKGGRPKKTQKTQPFFKKPKKADSVSVNDSVNDNVSSKLDIPQFSEFLEYALEKKPNVDQEAVKLKYESWKVNGWKTGGKSPRKIKNWKSTLLNTLKHLGEQKVESQEDAEAREIMEAIKRESTNQILYGNVQSDNDNSATPAIGGV